MIEEFRTYAQNTASVSLKFIRFSIANPAQGPRTSNFDTIWILKLWLEGSPA